MKFSIYHIFKIALYLGLVCYSTNAFSQISQSYDGVYTISNGNVLAEELPPIWPGCSGTLNDLKSCFNNKLSDHIDQNFIIPYQILQKTETNEIVVYLRVTKKGEVKIRKIKGGIIEIQDIARETFRSMPELKPGELAGKKVNSEYIIPISY